MDFLEHSYEMLLSMRHGKSIEKHLSRLASAGINNLKKNLETDISLNGIIRH